LQLFLTPADHDLQVPWRGIICPPRTVWNKWSSPFLLADGHSGSGPEEFGELEKETLNIKLFY
jgi:hypothetical protein